MSGEMAEPRVFVQKQQQQQPVSSLPPLAKAPFWYRYRAGVGALLLVNLGIGGYVLSRPQPVIDANPLKAEKLESEAAKEKNLNPKPQAAAVPVAASSSSVAAAAAEWAPPPPKATISEEEQREVLQWVLDERRKLKGLSKAEKARIDEEKRMLKQFLRGNHLPPLF